MNKILLILYCSLSYFDCFSQTKNKSFIKNHYCFESKDAGIEMDIFFKKTKNYVFIYYACGLGNGKYLNAYADTLDYAARMDLDKITENGGIFKIKSYYDDEKIFSVKISFNNNGNNMTWDISPTNKFTPHLPKHADFAYCIIK